MSTMARCTHQRDHALYCQASSADIKMNWKEPVALAAGYLNLATLHGAVTGNAHIYKRSFRGELANEEIVVLA